MLASNYDWCKVVAFAEKHNTHVRVGHVLYTNTYRDYMTDYPRKHVQYGIILYFAAYRSDYSSKDETLQAEKYCYRNLVIPRMFETKDMRDKYLMRMYHYSRAVVPIAVVGTITDKRVYRGQVLYTMPILFQLPKVKR